MSVRALTWALDQKAGDPTSKVILMVLADHANEDGECWPSIPRIAELAETTTRTVRRHLSALEEKGLLTRTERFRDNGSRASTKYSMPVHPPGQIVTPPVTECPGAPDTSDRGPLTPVSPLEPSLEPSVEEKHPRRASSEAGDVENSADPVAGLPPIAVSSIRGLYGGPGQEGTDERVWGSVTDPAERERILRTVVLRWVGEGHERFNSRLFRRILETVVQESTTSGAARASPAPSSLGPTYYDDEEPEQQREAS